MDVLLRFFIRCSDFKSVVIADKLAIMTVEEFFVVLRKIAKIFAKIFAIVYLTQGCITDKLGGWKTPKINLSPRFQWKISGLSSTGSTQEFLFPFSGVEL